MSEMKQEVTFETLKVLDVIRRYYATDVYGTAGKFPVMNPTTVRSLQPMIDAGLLTRDDSECPMKDYDGKIFLGECWVSLTPDGEAALAKATTP